MSNESTSANLIRPTISAEEFKKFSEFFYRKTGIHFAENKRYFVDKRLNERMAMTGSDSFREYFVNLRFDRQSNELQQLINSMTVNETYFFREEYHFRCMVRSMLNEVAASKKPGDRIRIWSVPCSSGEEPYSIAIYLSEFWPLLDKFEVEILASDIDTQILQQAERGLYSQRSVGQMPPDLLDRYFTRKPDGLYQLSSMIRESVTFGRANITEQSDIAHYRNIDLVFCRNLLIYFDDVARRAAAQTFYEALNPGGFVCLGHSESMSRISGVFQIRKFPEAIVYQRPLSKG